MTNSDEELAREGHLLLGRHLVAIVGTYVRPDSDVQWRQFNLLGVPPEAHRIQFAFTGVPTIFENQMYVLTAGHAVGEYLRAVCERQIFSTGNSLVDSFGVENPSMHGIPLEIDEAETIVVNAPDSGLDYAMIPLNVNQRRLLHANGVVPYTLSPASPVYDVKQCIAAGFPSERTSLLATYPGIQNDIYLQPIFLPISTLLDEERQFPMLHGRIERMGDIESIVGISGGPILGFVEPDQYTVVAIQSSWHRPSREIFATKVEEIAKHFSKAVGP
jgi:hypothetical protein